MSEGHTPGPWKVEPLDGKHYGTGIAIGNRVSITIWCTYDAEGNWSPPSERDPYFDIPDELTDTHYESAADLADATLIAAAPDLLEALEQTVRVFESGAFIEEVVKPAIAKAKGEQS